MHNVWFFFFSYFHCLLEGHGSIQTDIILWDFNQTKICNQNPRSAFEVFSFEMLIIYAFLFIQIV